MDIAVAAKVNEEDTALFLYNFGTKPPTGDQNDNQNKFASVAYGRSLEEVMDSVVRAAVQVGVGAQFGILSLADIEAKKGTAILAVEKDIKERFAKQGITVDFVGLSSGINFVNPEVQKAMDNLVIADMDAKRALKLAPTLPYLQATTNMEMQRNLAMALQKWNGALPALPSMVTVPNDAVGGLIQAFRALGGPPPAVPAR